MRTHLEFTNEESQFIGDIIRFILEAKPENKTDSALIEKFGEPAFELAKEWMQSSLEWERTKEERIQKIIEQYTKQSNPV